MTLRSIIQDAFSVKPYQVIGADWTNLESYQINAIMPKGATREVLPEMLRAMLAERFQLKYHQEKRQLPVYRLVVEARGATLQPAETDGEKPTSTPLGPRTHVGWVQTAGRFIAPSISLSEFCQWLSRQVNAPVVDQLNRPGRFSIDLKWDVDPAAPRNDPSHVQSDLLRVIRHDLGLTLTKARLPIEVLIIDNISKTPTEN
jgi:uncharacterized protein (TIGR03435 family)